MTRFKKFSFRNIKIGHTNSATVRFMYTKSSIDVYYRVKMLDAKILKPIFSKIEGRVFIIPVIQHLHRLNFQSE